MMDHAPLNVIDGIIPLSFLECDIRHTTPVSHNLDIMTQAITARLGVKT
jgi:hypothetical protein